MPRVKATANLVAKRKAEVKKIQLPTKGDKLVNQNELRIFADRDGAPSEGPYGHLGYRHDSDEEAAVTITGTAYEEFVHNKRFILTMQDDLIAEDGIDDRLEEDEGLLTTA